MSHRLIVIGRVTKPFGIKGEIRIVPFTETFDAFSNSDFLVFDRALKKVKGMRVHKGNALVFLDGINNPEEAKALSGCFVKTDETNLPPKKKDEYYWFELIGMKVFTSDGRELGELVGITPTGANDVLEVQGVYGEILLPMIEDVVVDVDTENNRMTVDPLEGLIPDD
jgi:16S rRNA processing protein RimM